jgi:hypothetical protein
MLCALRPVAAIHSLYNQATVVPVRYESEIIEVYVENCLLYPKVHLGSLALAQTG